MLNSGKKIRTLCDKKNKYSNSCCPKKKILNKTNIYFFCRTRCEFFFQNLTLGYMPKTLNQIIFLSSTKIRIFFSATLGIRIFFYKKPTSIILQLFSVILPDFYFIYNFLQKFNFFFKLLNFTRLILIFLDCFLFNIYFFCRTRCEIYFQNLTLGYMPKTLNQIIFLSSTKNRIFFSATLGIRIFFYKKPTSIILQVFI
jgi:ribosomal protein L24E